MLRALGEQLKLLAADPRNHYASTIRRLMGPRDAVRFGHPLRQMILAMPRMIAQLQKWSDGSGLPVRIMRLQRFALAYLYNPIDFLSANNSGLFRFLDDAYLIACIYQRTLADLDGAGIRNRSDDPALTKNISAWIELASLLLPSETAKIDELLGEVARGRRTSVFPPVTRKGPGKDRCVGLGTGSKSRATPIKKRLCSRCCSGAARRCKGVHHAHHGR